MRKAEITWSLMHPTALDAVYMQKVVEHAKNADVDSFEICGGCHSLLGGLDGLVTYEDFPQVSQSIDIDGILKNRETFEAILDLAHSIGKPVYYWHREVTVCPKILEIMPELRDRNGEFDLLGEKFAWLMKYKLTNAFEAMPNLDGVVLTLTEADFSAIHNSCPEIYPPEKVVEHIVNIFTEECKNLSKRFILRSFGSIAKDYEDILAGAKLSAQTHSFEVETKITPYDFNPFLPDNPFLAPIAGLTLGAECDCLGEFLGAGFLPAENIENIVRYVRFGQQRGVDRFVIRIDRMCNDIFDSYPINLYAYTRAIRDTKVTAPEIIAEYARKYYPKNATQKLIELGKIGLEAVQKIHYIDHQLFFHQFPLKADLKWLKAGGVFSVFASGQSMSMHTGIWSILVDRNAPERRAIISEKESAQKIAKDGLQKLTAMQNDLSETEYNRLYRLWHNLYGAATAVLALCRMIKAYFDCMEKIEDVPTLFFDEINHAEMTITPLLSGNKRYNINIEFINGMDHHAVAEKFSDLDEIYYLPILGIGECLKQEYKIELSMRKKLLDCKEVILPGAITDDYRIGRYMHASHTIIQNGEIGRFVGNQVFPNGFLKMKVLTGGKLEIQGSGEGLRISVNDNAPDDYRFDADCKIIIDIQPDSELTIQKTGFNYPIVFSLQIRHESGMKSEFISMRGT